MATVKDIFDLLSSAAPLELQMDFDNAGFLFGDSTKSVSRVLLSLDVTENVADEAYSTGAQLIISHHPLIFRPLKRITSDNAEGRLMLKLAKYDLSVISMHTNLDIAVGGVNDVLMKVIGAETDGVLADDGCGRIGHYDEPIELEDFLALCRERLSSNGLRYVSGGRPVRNIAVAGGAGAEYLQRAADMGCDTLLTADVKYHQFLQARELGMNLVDGDHYGTEQPVIQYLAKKLQAAFPETEFAVSEVHRCPVQFCD